MAHGVLYRCQNPNCRLEVENSPTTIPTSTKPICNCGSPMKRVYKKPILREMSREEADLILSEALPDEFSTVSGKSG